MWQGRFREERAAVGADGERAGFGLQFAGDVETLLPGGFSRLPEQFEAVGADEEADVTGGGIEGGQIGNADGLNLAFGGYGEQLVALAKHIDGFPAIGWNFEGVGCQHGDLRLSVGGIHHPLGQLGRPLGQDRNEDRQPRFDFTQLVAVENDQDVSALGLQPVDQRFIGVSRGVQFIPADRQVVLGEKNPVLLDIDDVRWRLGFGIGVGFRNPIGF